MTASHHFYLDKSDDGSWRALNGLALKVATAAEEAGISRAVVELVNVRISQLNGCAFCLDLHSRRASEAGITDQQLALLTARRETGAFTDQERAALTIGEAATTLPEAETRVAELAAARSLLSDAQYSALQWLAITMNAFNRVSVLSEHQVRVRKTSSEDAGQPVPGGVGGKP